MVLIKILKIKYFVKINNILFYNQKMNLVNFIKKEFQNWGNTEKFLFPALIFLIITISIINNDSPVSIFSAACGITYTILAGKGKISCYITGISGTLCYAYLALKNGFYANSLLYALYYFPMEIIGIYKWKKHLDSSTNEILKTKLPLNKKIKLFIITTILSAICGVFLELNGGNHPFLDSFASVFSVSGMYLTVKRCIEQWYVWFLVNLLSCMMWCFSFMQGGKHIALLLMWVVYLCLAVYFWYNWKNAVKCEDKQKWI